MGYRFKSIMNCLQYILARRGDGEYYVWGCSTWLGFFRGFWRLLGVQLYESTVLGRYYSRN